MLVGQCSVLKNRRVLIVDDEIEVQFPLMVLLQLQQAHVIDASSVREALRVLKSHRVDVLLSDIEMPGEDGYSLMQQVKTLFPNQQERPTAIAMTGLAPEEIRERALSAGFQAYLRKPFEGSELLMTLSTLLDPNVEADLVSEHRTIATQMSGTFV